MNRRLQQFLLAENISQSQFADSIGVAKASVSHILAGRNKPGFEFLEGMSRHYPDLNLEWLISGKGKMYKTAVAEASPAPSTPPPAPAEPLPTDLFSNSQADDNAAENEELAQSVAPYSKNEGSGKAKITKIMVFYDDGTYKELE